MTDLELKPTTENLIDSLENNSIGRNEDIFSFITLLQNIYGGSSVALDAKWGSGKTFFVKQAKLVLDSFNENTYNYNEEQATRIKNIASKYNTNININMSCVTVYYDAWENDNDIDPVLSITHSIIQELGIANKITKDRNSLDILGDIVDAITNRNIKSLINDLSGEDIFNKISKEKELKEKIKNFLKSLLPEHGDRLIIIIDEFDRCKPSFAISLLERIKHYFDIEEIVFVFSTNLSELKYTIEKYYGNGFNSTGYLDKFFNITVALPPANIDRFYNHIGLNNGTWIYENTCKKVIKTLNFENELRKIAHFYTLARIDAYKPTHEKNNTRVFFEEGTAINFCLFYIVPLMIGLRLSNMDDYDDFINGKNGQFLHNIIDEDDLSRNGFINRRSLLNQKDNFVKNPNEDISKIIDDIYDAIFIYDYSDTYEPKTIGNYTFTGKTKGELLKIIAGLSNKADYSF